jgi:hypothetical protein
MRERQTVVEEEEEEEEAATRGEREKERTNQTGCLERHGEKYINCRQGCCAFFQVSTACEKTNGQRRTPTVI